jgi:hypothetical protein
VLARLAQALRLSNAERAYLFELARRRDPVERELRQDSAAAIVARSVHLVQCPAYVLDRGWDVVSANAAAHDLFLGWGSASAGKPNLLRFLFLDPVSRTLVYDWPSRARRIVAEFRADCGRAVGAPGIAAQVKELSASSKDFARWWQARAVMEREGGQRRFVHPRHGELVFEQLTLRPVPHAGFKLVMLLPVV